jgi:hypothetical protein
VAENTFGQASFYEAVLKQAVTLDYQRELAAIPSEEELAEVFTYSPRHIARMNRLFVRDARRKFSKDFFFFIKKTVLAAAIVVLILSGLLILNPTVRAVVVNTVATWFETFTRFYAETPAQTDQFTANWRPAYVPEGFAETDTQEGIAVVAVVYQSETARIFLNYSRVNGMLSVDSDDSEYREQTIGEMLFYIFGALHDGGDNIVVWEKEGIRFSLTSTLPVSELLLMAQSVSDYD